MLACGRRNTSHSNYVGFSLSIGAISIRLKEIPHSEFGTGCGSRMPCILAAEWLVFGYPANNHCRRGRMMNHRPFKGFVMHIKASLKLQTKAHLALTDRQPSGYSVEGTEYGVATFASVGTRGNSRAVA